MLFRLALVLLGPLLFLQGRHVRRVTPRLPEAAGEREGRTGSGPPLSVLVLGDSAAAGVGVRQQAEALSGQLGCALGARHSVHWRLMANSGDRLDQLLGKLAVAPEPDPPVDWVVISIGVNDVTALRRTAAWLGDLQALIALLRQRYGQPQILFSSLPPMDQFPALPQPLRWWMGQRARAFDAQMRAVAGAQVDCHYLAIPYVVEPEAIAADGFHPGPGAYRIWGRAAAERILAVSSAVGAPQR